MARRRVALTHRKQRSVLTDMLPFEVPLTFSNRGFYRFLRKYGVEIAAGRVHWVSDSDALDVTMRLLFGFNANAHIKTATSTEWGRTLTRRSVELKACRFDTIPFNFRVAHKLEGRTLSVVHPRNQIDVACFYANNAALVVYYASLSEFSIRYPVSVSRYAYFRDKLHEQKVESVACGIEEDDREYEQLGSYFVYRKYRNIHKFFESYKYHRCEKKYNAMVQIDVSKCFDSIYTHSLSWAVIGKSQTKFNLDTTARTFAGRFDRLMQYLNHRETNGIVIGPEFSRIFAEIILQSIDVELQGRLLHYDKLVHKIDYEIFRYVDDYFVFYNEDTSQPKIIEALQNFLKDKKLNINPAKIKTYEKPIITEITIAKERISSLLNSDIDPRCEEVGDVTDDQPVTLVLASGVNSNRLIIRYKTIIKETKVEYGDLLNYTFAIIENKIERLFKCYLDTEKTVQDSKRLVRTLLAVIEFAFFAYSASPKVNHTIRICRMMSSAIEFLNLHGIAYDLKHLLFKYIHDNIVQQIDKNVMSHYREVENLYLLISLSQIGREYWLPEAALIKYFSITTDDNGEYIRKDFLSHFSITVLLSYIKTKIRYNKLRIFIENHIVDKLNYMKALCFNDAECLMLLFDIVVCPYISDHKKAEIAQIFGLDAVALTRLQASNEQWFTAWGDKFEIGRELDAKRSREVY